MEHLQMPLDQDIKFNELNKALGHRLKSLRVTAGMRQNELADAMNFTSNYLSMVEAGRREPSLKFLRKFSLLLKVPLSVIFLHETPEKEEHSTPLYSQALANNIDLANNIMLRDRFSHDENS